MKKIQKLYVLSMPKKKTLISKIGETQVDMKRRITAFGMGGKWKRMESKIRIEMEIPTLLAPSVERIVKATLQGKWKDKQIKDRNMGRGYTEWYDIAPSTMKAIVRQSFAKLYRKDRLLKRKIKRRST